MHDKTCNTMLAQCLRACQEQFKTGRVHELGQLQSLLTLFGQLQREHFDFEHVLARALADGADRQTAQQAPIRYVHVHEEASFSAGLFVFPPGASIPLHDHPGMAVLSRVLHGSLGSASFDFIADSGGETARQLLEAHGCFLSMPVTAEVGRMAATGAPGAAATGAGGGLVTAVAPSTLRLLPSEGNLHEFVSGPSGCVVFDVLSPPYNAHEGRDCTYYRRRSSAPPELHELAAAHGPSCMLLEAFVPPDREFCVISDSNDVRSRV